MTIYATTDSSEQMILKHLTLILVVAFVTLQTTIADSKVLICKGDSFPVTNIELKCLKTKKDAYIEMAKNVGLVNFKIVDNCGVPKKQIDTTFEVDRKKIISEHSDEIITSRIANVKIGRYKIEKANASGDIKRKPFYSLSLRQLIQLFSKINEIDSIQSSETYRTVELCHEQD